MPAAPLTTTHTEDVTALAVSANDGARGARQAAPRLFVASLDTTVSAWDSLANTTVGLIEARAPAAHPAAPRAVLG